MKSADFIKYGDVKPRNVGGSAERRVLGYDDNLMMVEVKFCKGDVGALHSHPHAQVSYIASGVFRFTVNGVAETLHAGDAVHMESGVGHSCECLEDGAVIDCFNPAREDFL